MHNKHKLSYYNMCVCCISSLFIISLLYGSTHLFDWHAHFEDFGITGQNFIGGVDLQEMDLLSFFLYKFKHQEALIYTIYKLVIKHIFYMLITIKINQTKFPMKICVFRVFALLPTGVIHIQ